jgi:competence protein ComGC
MIKIKIKASSLIKEASVRYLTERYKIPPEFVEFVNSEYRQTADSLIHVFSKSNMFEIAMASKENPEKFVNSLKNQFTTFMQDFNGIIVDKLLKKAPKFKKDIISIADESGFNGVIRFAEEQFDVYDLEADKKLTSIRFPDGYYWIDTNKTQCPREAKYMHHCGTAAFGGTLYSLRNPNDKPEVTIEMNAEKHEIYQMFHFNNELPPDKYIPYIKKFVEHYEIPPEGLNFKFTPDENRLTDIIFQIYYGADKSFDNMFKYLKGKIPQDKEMRLGRDNVLFFEKHIRNLTKVNDLSIEEYFKLYLLFSEAISDSRFRIDSFERFFEAANFDKKDNEFKAGLLDKIIDYYLENNLLDKSSQASAINNIIKSHIIKALDLPIDELKKLVEIYEKYPFAKKLLQRTKYLKTQELVDDMLTNSQYYRAEPAIEIFPKYLKTTLKDGGEIPIENAAHNFLNSFRPDKFVERKQFVEWIFNSYPQLFEDRDCVIFGLKNLKFWSEKDTDQDEEEMLNSDIYKKLKTAKADLDAQKEASQKQVTESGSKKIKESRIRIIINSRKY